MIKQYTWLWLSFIIVAVICMVAINSVDIIAAQYMRENHKPIFEFFTYMSMLGHGTFWFALAGGMLFLGMVWSAKEPSDISYRLASVGGFGLASLLVSGVVLRAAKFAFGRTRPRYYIEEQIYEFAPFTWDLAKHVSFPSGHAQTIATVMVVMMLLKPKLWPICVPLVVLVAASRVVLLEHYVSDVIAGVWVGVVMTILVWRVWNDYCVKHNHQRWRLCM